MFKSLLRLRLNIVVQALTSAWLFARPHGLQHARLLCLPLYPRVCANFCSWSQCVYLATPLTGDHENPREGILGCRQSGQEGFELREILSFKRHRHLLGCSTRDSTNSGLLKLTGEWSVVLSPVVRTGMWENGNHVDSTPTDPSEDLHAHTGTSVENSLLSRV